MRPPMVALVGTTASGKSALGLELARRRPDLEIVSVDSMQVYRGMDIGTATPTQAEQREVRHHLIDLVEPWEEFSLAQFQAEARKALADVAARGHRALLLGGTGLYLRAIVDDLDIPGRYPQVRAELDADPDTRALHRRLRDIDPQAAERMEPDNRRRIVRALEVTLGSGRPFSSFGPGLMAHPGSTPQIGVRLPAEVVARRIEQRYHHQVEVGFVAEVEALTRLPHPLSRTAAQALGYREVLAHLRGEMTLDAALAEAVARTRRFARRQRAWFRRDERVRWFDAEDPSVLTDDLLAAVDAALVPAGEWPEEPGAGLRD